MTPVVPKPTATQVLAIVEAFIAEHLLEKTPYEAMEIALIAMCLQWNLLDAPEMNEVLHTLEAHRGTHMRRVFFVLITAFNAGRFAGSIGLLQMVAPAPAAQTA